MTMLSFLGIIASLVIIIVGALKGRSLILTSTLAALVCALLGGIATVASPEFTGNQSFWEVFFSGYAVTYMQGVASIVIDLFPLFLGGQLFGKLLEKTDLHYSIANMVFRKMGTKGTVSAVFVATLLLSIAGINVYVIIFTMYPLAAAFYKEAGLPRALIPANILGAAVAQQAMPGVPIFNLVIPAQAFGVTPMAGFTMAVTSFIIIGGLNLWYLNSVAGKLAGSGEGFVDKAGSTTNVDLSSENFPNPFLLLVPLGVIIILMNVFAVPAWAALFAGSVVIAIMFFKRLEGMGNIIKLLTEGAEQSQGVMATGALCGLANLIGAVPGFSIVLGILEKSSFGSPYIFAAVAVAIVAGFAGSAMGGLQFVIANFKDTLLATGASPAALTRIVAVGSLTFDSLPHNSAIIITNQYCNVTHKEGYKYMFVCTVCTTILATIVTVIMAHLGIY